MADKSTSTDHSRSPEEIQSEIERTRADMSRTIDAIQRRLSPGELMDQALDYFRSGPGEFASNLGDAIRNNPVPVALVGVGLAWLAFGGPGRPAYLHRADTEGGSDMGYAGETARHGMEQAGDMAARTGQRLGGMASAAGARMGDAYAGARDTADAASERVRAMADDVRNLAAEWREDTVDMATRAQDRMQQLGGSVQAQTAQMRDAANDLLHQQPLIVGALGLAIGAMLGAMLPSTRQEDTLMGEARDRVVDQASGTGEQVMREAAHVTQAAADAATDAAREETERRGLGAGRTDMSQSTAKPENEGKPTDPPGFATKGI
ncbi:MAG TPA: DUF3618 domain-containing protein [Alphaproteobacteria bacterium]